MKSIFHSSDNSNNNTINVSNTDSNYHKKPKYDETKLEITSNESFKPEFIEKIDSIQTKAKKIQKIYEATLNNSNLDKHFLMRNYNLDIDTIEDLYKYNLEYITGMRTKLLISFFGGLLYCGLHTRKLLRNNRGFKSFYCWGGLVFAEYLSMVYFLNKYQSAIQDKISNVLIDNEFGFIKELPDKEKNNYYKDIKVRMMIYNNKAKPWI